LDDSRFDRNNRFDGLVKALCLFQEGIWGAESERSGRHPDTPKFVDSASPGPKALQMLQGAFLSLMLYSDNLLEIKQIKPI
jgi:hypothetical protein